MNEIIPDYSYPDYPTYHIYSIGSTRKGIVQVQLKYLLKKDGEFFAYFNEMRLAENSRIGLIEYFYPNGLPKSGIKKDQELENLMRRGVGSEALSFVLEDIASKFDVRMVYYNLNETDEEYMRKFLLERHGFNEIVFNEKSKYCYKIIALKKTASI
jgi:hypothetical protein